MLSDAVDHYREGREDGRLSSASGRLEFERTLDLLSRHLPPPPSRLLDVGGGTGPYAFELTRRGHRVDLLDLMPEHVEAARAKGDLHGFHVGDARKLPFGGETFDAVLLMGPLYHLTEDQDRLLCLTEARRVLKQGGAVFAVAISRFASLLDGLACGYDGDPVFRGIVEQDLAEGQHRNDTNHPSYFTTAYFHHPDDLCRELTWAGFTVTTLAAVEGPAAFASNWAEKTQEQRDFYMSCIRQAECDPALIGASAHFAAVGVRW